MRTSIAILGFLLYALAAGGCGDAAPVQVKIYTSPTGRITLGSGWNTWDHWWDKVPGRYRLGWNEEQWDSYLTLLGKSGADWMRVDFYYGNTEPRNDNDDPEIINWSGFTFDSPRLGSLYKHLDFAQANGIDVYLTYTYLRSNHEYNLDPESGWLSREAVSKGFPELWTRPRDEPLDKRELAENLAATTYHLIKKRGYTTIKQVSLYVEPDNGRANGGQWKNVDGYQDTHFLAKALGKLGIRKEVAIIAPHAGIENPEAWPPQGGDYDIHGVEDYQSMVDWEAPEQGLRKLSPVYQEMVNELKRASPPRQAALMEYGNFWTHKAAGPLPSYLGTLSTSCLVFGLYNLGFAGVQRWAFEPVHHPWRGTAAIKVGGVEYSPIGPDRRDSSFKKRVESIVALMEKGAKIEKVPQTYEPQRLVNANLRRGSTVYEIEVIDPTPPGKGMCAIAVRNAADQWHVGLINLYPGSRKVEVVFPNEALPKSLQWEYYTPPADLLVRLHDWLGNQLTEKEPFRLLGRATRFAVRKLHSVLGGSEFSPESFEGKVPTLSNNSVSLELTGRSINFLSEAHDSK